MKNKKIVLNLSIILSVIMLVSCTKGNKENQNTVDKTNQNQQVNDNDSNTDNNDSKNENSNGNTSENKVTKIEGRRKEFLERLDNIQKEIDALPEKKDSDAGVTNAMKNYYGIGYEMYDKELNNIYALLQKELSKEVMESLEQEEIKWIDEKEKAAKEESLKYKGGTFEFVADKVSLYEATKNRCYELVNTYMTD
ncbi:lysozyme inhibitor LprI family protein [Clostridium sp.]|uniref:lysozyme inhibitor LprI family protein n=1 Tax=Clostridium sp. TaxID=1506 RepID=UPI002909B261|nr:lysozyme inhibitor LprI family protein [Clostridium sp.]MDU5108257.1 lysozyme inhibitor LprI family protein [Clostridium sp.]